MNAENNRMRRIRFNQPQRWLRESGYKVPKPTQLSAHGFGADNHTAEENDRDGGVALGIVLVALIIVAAIIAWFAADFAVETVAKFVN